MKISIAMATYNGETYLQEQLDSFVVQTRLPDELVVCDDGSSDGTLEVLRQFANAAPFKVNINQNAKNLGYVKNFEKAMSLCSGDIIFLSDQDDVWFSEKIMTITNAFLANPDIYLIQSNMILADVNMQHSDVTLLDNVVALGGKSLNFDVGCGIGFRRELREILLPIPVPLWGHDGWLGRLSRTIFVHEVIHSPLMFYRRHGSNVSNSLASDTKELSHLDTIRTHGLNDARKGWKAEMTRLQDIADRMTERKSLISRIVDEEKVNQAVHNIENQRMRLSKRITLCSKSRLVRFPFVANLLIKGGYSQFSGWKSALKDVIRP